MFFNINIGKTGVHGRDSDPLGDVVTTGSRRDYQKSKFGLRHRIKLNELYTVTKSEF
jgi:hypothetical protein